MNTLSRRATTRRLQSQRRKAERQINSLRKQATTLEKKYGRGYVASKALREQANDLVKAIKATATRTKSGKMKDTIDLGLKGDYLEEMTIRSKMIQAPNAIFDGDLKLAKEGFATKTFGKGKAARKEAYNMWIYYAKDWKGVSPEDRMQVTLFKNKVRTMAELYSNYKKAAGEAESNANYYRYVAMYEGLDLAKIDTNDPGVQEMLNKEVNDMTPSEQRDLYEFIKYMTTKEAKKG